MTLKSRTNCTKYDDVETERRHSTSNDQRVVYAKPTFMSPLAVIFKLNYVKRSFVARFGNPVEMIPNANSILFSF